MLFICLSTCSLTQSLSGYLSVTIYAPSSVLGTRDTMLDKVPALKELTGHEGRWTSKGASTTPQDERNNVQGPWDPAEEAPGSFV